MKRFEKSRPRLLVIANNPSVRDDLVTLLTGYGYFVDYVGSRSEGIAKFRQYKHAVVIISELDLPHYPLRLFKLFKFYQRNPIILIAASRDQEDRIYPFLQQGVYDILHLPLRGEYVYRQLSRLVEHNRTQAHAEFMKTFIVLTILISPIIATLMVVLMQFWSG